MSPRPTPLTDLLRSVVGSEAHASAPAERGKAGGEWDSWYHLSLKNRRRLIGARWARSGAMPPDELGDLIVRAGVVDDWRDGLDWFYRHALASIVERRTAAETDSRLRHANNNGAYSHYFHRNNLAIAEGHRSLYARRLALGWGDGHTARWHPHPVCQRCSERHHVGWPCLPR